MRKFSMALGALSAISLTFSPILFAAQGQENSTDLPKITITNFNSFTGKISKGKVRMRGSPSLDAPIIREMSKGELIIVVGETDEFYTVQPPADVKGYIFRTFVLDNKVEGNRVNVRLSPNTDAPVIAQMNSGDTVDGTISPINNKWLEVSPPTSARFYIAKEFIEKVGDEHFMAKVAKRRDEVNRLLQSNYAISQQELQKSFPDVKTDRIIANYEMISKDYADFPEQANRAKELLEELRENYLHKKISYLEALAASRQNTTVSMGQSTSSPISMQEAQTTFSADPTIRVAYWSPVENSRFEEWKASGKTGTLDDFYQDEQKNASSLTGVITPYTRSIKNKPGDYVLLNKATNLPIAFIYSTKVNLNEYVGKEVTIEGSSRPNNHFAYPAFFVLSIQ
jgi:hypothetical protein